MTIDGARISYNDSDIATKQIVDAGLAYNTIYDANGDIATDTSFLARELSGLSRFRASVPVRRTDSAGMERVFDRRGRWSVTSNP